MVLVACLLKTIDHNLLHLDQLQNIVVQEGLNLIQHTKVIGMEKEHKTIIGQKFVKKNNDRINEVVHTLILAQDREC
jgi:hypothetical protein